MHLPWMHNQYQGNLNPTCPHHPKNSMKGIRLHAYVSTTVYDRSWKGSTEQFVLHFHEQFRHLDELTPQDEQLPHSVILTLLQTAVRSVPELRIVETMEEYIILTPFTIPSHITNTSPCSKMPVSDMAKSETETFSTARAVYQHEIDGDSGTDGDDGDYVEDGFAHDGIDTLSDDFYSINTTNFNRNPQ